MKTLGLVGGTGWVSSVDYYRLINQGINKALGGHEFARCILYSINFGDIVVLNQRNDSDGIYELIKDATDKVIQAGAEGIVICANTMHKFADRLQEEIGVQIIHIAEATAREVNSRKLHSVGLLGTRYTMEEDFYTSKLEAANIRTIVPEASDREFIDATIYNELLKEIFKNESKNRFLEIMKKMQEQGAEGIVLGCTEIPLIIKEDDLDLPLFNTTAIHARAAVDFALSK
ncbi:MAG: aspartate/glutamate racemase family protein [Candidatus Zixiibacteriota bacterium]|nr:MAG: aspartate/glutamate racemase family protein [candidate division Zixibacteria bacterium]